MKLFYTSLFILLFIAFVMTSWAWSEVSDTVINLINGDNTTGAHTAINMRYPIGDLVCQHWFTGDNTTDVWSNVSIQASIDNTTWGTLRTDNLTIADNSTVRFYPDNHSSRWRANVLSKNSTNNTSLLYFRCRGRF